MTSDPRRNEPALKVRINCPWPASVGVEIQNEETARYWDGKAWRDERVEIRSARAAEKPRRSKARRRPLAGGRTK